MTSGGSNSHAALVTGGAVRIGRAITLALANAGIDVVVHYRNSGDEARQLCRTIEQCGVRAWSVQADLAEMGESERLIDVAFAAAGALDVLVNNASIFPLDDLGSMTFDRLVTNMRVNAWAPLVLSRAFARRVGHGHIVNLLDSRIVDEDFAHVGYILSKQVLAALTRMTALAFAPNVAVNAVAPGLILPPPGASHEYIDERIDTVPLKKHGSPDEVARAVLFLARSEYLTGEVLFVDGGRHLREYLHHG